MPYTANRMRAGTANPIAAPFQRLPRRLPIPRPIIAPGIGEVASSQKTTSNSTGSHHLSGSSDCSERQRKTGKKTTHPKAKTQQTGEKRSRFMSRFYHAGPTAGRKSQIGSEPLRIAPHDYVSVDDFSQPGQLAKDHPDDRIGMIGEALRQFFDMAAKLDSVVSAYEQSRPIVLELNRTRWCLTRAAGERYFGDLAFHPQILP